MILLKDVSYVYPSGIKVLNNLNLKIEHGEKVFVGGKTACGKSTLLRTFNGLIPYFYGGVLNGEISVYNSNANVKNVFLASQHPEEQIIANKVIDEVSFPLIQRGLKWGEAEEIAFKAAKLCKMEHLLERRTSELSEGEKQLVVIATAVASNARCIVLDEPFAHLHASKAEEILNKILKMDRTIVVSEHRIELAEKFSRGLWLGEQIEERDFHPPSRDFERNAIIANSLSFAYNKNEVLSSILFEVPEGGVYAVTGLNGAGKTTLLKVIAGILKPKEGSIEVKGKVAMSFQYPNYHFSEKYVEREVERDLLKKFGLLNLAKRHPHSLSVGEAKRLSIAKAFRGDIVLLDEPTAGQDYEFRMKLVEIAMQSGKTVLIATHDKRLALLCDGVIEL
jgi:energy-coupling factor transport system ATP-binding protein